MTSTRDARAILVAIKAQATELLAYASAGGEQEAAFDLLVGKPQLHAIEMQLYDLGTDIRDGVRLVAK